MYRIGKVLNHNAVLAVNGEDGKQYLLMGKGESVLAKRSVKG